jgi:dienelactone hydrolase/alpha/beta superfamily hydrolase
MTLVAPGLALAAGKAISAYPTWLDAAGEHLAAWHYPAAAPARAMAVVVVPSVGYEDRVTEGGAVDLARALAGAGFEVLTFDHHGTDQSPGSLDDPNLVGRWVLGTRAALDSFPDRPVAVVSFRLGCLLALEALADRPVELLCLLSPTLNGRRFVRELRMLAATGAHAGAADEMVTAGGFAYPESMLADIAEIAVGAMAAAPAATVVVVDSPERPTASQLDDVLVNVGSSVERWTADDLSNWMDVVNSAAASPVGTIARLVDHMVQQAGLAAPTGSPSSFPDGGPVRLHCADGAISEQRMVLGEARLGAILAEPITTSTHDVAVLFLSTTGPGDSFNHAAHRLAAAGVVSLRLDFAGFRESGRWPGQPPGSAYYGTSGAHDIREGVNALRAIGCDQVIVVGICSAAWSMLTTGPLPEVHALVAINPQLFVSKSGQIPAFTQNAVAGKRCASIKLRWLLAIAKARLHHYARREIRHVTRAGTQVHVVFADGDPGHRFWRYALAPLVFARARVTLHVVPNLGHNLENVAARAQVIDLIATLAGNPHPTPGSTH